jgi:hypothetical protein
VKLKKRSNNKSIQKTEWVYMPLFAACIVLQKLKSIEHQQSLNWGQSPGESEKEKILVNWIVQTDFKTEIQVHVQKSDFSRTELSLLGIHCHLMFSRPS